METRTFWEKCDSVFAHLEIGKWLKDKDSLFGQYKLNVLDHIDIDNKTIIDYGIGGGYLGELMLSKYGIYKYIGIDISERSIKAARSNLKKWNDKIDLRLTGMQFKDLSADIFISIACIQHFPNKEYLDSFLCNLNTSDIPILFLQYRYSNPIKFITGYDKLEDVRLACSINKEYLLSELTNYKIDYISDIHENSMYQYVKLIKK